MELWRICVVYSCVLQVVGDKRRSIDTKTVSRLKGSDTFHRRNLRGLSELSSPAEEQTQPAAGSRGCETLTGFTAFFLRFITPNQPSVLTITFPARSISSSVMCKWHTARIVLIPSGSINTPASPKTLHISAADGKSPTRSK